MAAARKGGGRKNTGGGAAQDTLPPGACRVNGLILPYDMADELKDLNVDIDKNTHEV